MIDNNDKFNPHFLAHRKHKEDTQMVENEQRGGNLNFGPYVAMYYARSANRSHHGPSLCSMKCSAPLNRG